jgi:sigma-B regulation protein RsbU (phosphoserine phosphatase)
MGPGRAGGDVEYLSVCPECNISRIALADVSGHGEAVAVFGVKLRELMQKHLHFVEQVALTRDLNQAVPESLGEGHYATMVAFGSEKLRDRMVLTNAGHPPPLFYRVSRAEWSWIETERVSEREHPAGLPLGLLADVTYEESVLDAQSGDLIVLYSDGVSEANSPAGNELGRDGLMNLVRPLDTSSADGFGTQLVSALNNYRGGGEPVDDQTIIVIRKNDI